MKARKLTPKQERFVHAYAKSGNATKAAREAGYSELYADRQAAQLLGKSWVKKALAELTAKLARPTIATITDRQEWWTEVIRDGKAKLADRLRASELLGKSQGDFIENHRHGGPNGEPLAAAVVVRITRPADAKPVNESGFMERQSLNGHAH